MNVEKLSVRQLNSIKASAESDYRLLTKLQIECSDPKQRLGYNGQIKSRLSIIKKVNEQLLKLKNLQQ